VATNVTRQINARHGLMTDLFRIRLGVRATTRSNVRVSRMFGDADSSVRRMAKSRNG
jgi:hypothetical protein